LHSPKQVYPKQSTAQDNFPEKLCMKTRQSLIKSKFRNAVYSTLIWRRISVLLGTTTAATVTTTYNMTIQILL